MIEIEICIVCLGERQVDLNVETFRIRKKEGRMKKVLTMRK